MYLHLGILEPQKIRQILLKNYSKIESHYTEQGCVAKLEDKYASFMKLWGGIRTPIVP